MQYMSICVESRKLVLEQFGSAFRNMGERWRPRASPTSPPYCISRLRILLWHRRPSKERQYRDYRVYKALCRRKGERENECLPRGITFPCSLLQPPFIQRGEKKDRSPSCARLSAQAAYPPLDNEHFSPSLHLSHPFLRIHQSLTLPTSDAAAVAPCLAESSFYIWHYSSAQSPELL